MFNLSPPPRFAKDARTGELLRVLRIVGDSATVVPAARASVQHVRVVALRDLQPVDAWAVNA